MDGRPAPATCEDAPGTPSRPPPIGLRADGEDRERPAGRASESERFHLLGVTPFVHWSLAPSTADVAAGDSLAEGWMRGEHGALAAYGSVATTPTELTHEVGHWLGLLHTTGRALRHGMLLDAAEFKSEQTYAGEGTAVADRFQLVGDPSMVVPNGNSAATDDVYIDGNIITAENYDSALIEFGPDGGTVKVRVEDEHGDPVDGALVSLVVGHSSIGSDGELVQLPSQDDAYTVDGVADLSIELTDDELAKLPASMHTGGIHLTMADGSVRFIADCIALIGSDFDDLGGQVANALGEAPRLLSTDTVEGGETLELRLENGRPLSAGAPFLAFQHNPAPFEGGVFHALPVGLSFPFATDGAGDAAFVLGPLPNPVPAGLKLVFQAVVADLTAPSGLTLSNGLIHGD